ELLSSQFSPGPDPPHSPTFPITPLATIASTFLKRSSDFLRYGKPSRLRTGTSPRQVASLLLRSSLFSTSTSSIAPELSIRWLDSQASLMTRLALFLARLLHTAPMPSVSLLDLYLEVHQ